MTPRKDNEDDLWFKPDGTLRTVEDQNREFDEIMDAFEALIEEQERKGKK